MKNFYKTLLIMMVVAFCNSTNAQICLGEDTTICQGQSVVISAVCSGPSSPVYVLDSMQQVTLTDDQYSGVVNIGFPFTYYGVAYTQLVIASNNYVTFDLTQANGYSPWSIGSPIPNPGLPINSIMGPYQDINPALGGTIEYGIIGTAPNRKFVIRYNQVPMFSCTNDIFCSSIFLFEGTNKIEVHIDNKPLCPTWNAGVAIEGNQDVSGTLAAVVTGRNFPTQWTAAADGVQMVPLNPTSYSVAPIPYIPSLLASGVQWWDTWGNFLGTGISIPVTPTNDTTGYYVVYDQCYTSSSGPQNTDTAWVYISKPLVSATATGINCIDTAGTAIAIATGIAPLTYQWNDPLNQTTSTATNLPYGNYTVVVTDSIGCTNQALVSIDSLLYTLNVGSTSTLCNGDSTGSAFVSVTPFFSNITYLWDANSGFQTNDTATGIQAGTYTIIITDSIGCKDSATVVVNEPLPFTVLDSITNPSCIGVANGNIVVSVSGGTPGYTYSWGNNQLTGLLAGTYPIIITDSNNCTYVDSFLLVDPPGMTITLDSFPASCGLGDGSILAYVQGGTPGYTYNWIPGGIGSDTLQNIITGGYSVIITDANGCSDTASTFVNQIKGFSGGFSLLPSQGPAPLSVSFIDNSVNCVTYFWDFGNGTTSTSNSPGPVIYQNDGTYTVTLIACNGGGCCDTIVKTVLVESQSICNFGKVFTPNGDGLNDEFRVVCERISEFDIIIFNRWGNEMFTSNDINVSWDGTKGGDEVPEGTYYYIIKALGKDGQDWSGKGSLSLFR